MHLRCHTQQEIADAVGIDRTVVSDKIAEFVENGKYSDSHIFRDFDRDDSTRQTSVDQRHSLTPDSPQRLR